MGKGQRGSFQPSLLGNAATHISTKRKKSLMKLLNKHLHPMKEEYFPDKGAYLFGEELGTKLKLSQATY